MNQGRQRGGGGDDGDDEGYDEDDAEDPDDEIDENMMITRWTKREARLRRSLGSFST